MLKYVHFKLEMYIHLFLSFGKGEKEVTGD